MTLRRTMLGLLLLLPGPVLAAGPKVFPDPPAAMEALLSAARTGQAAAVVKVLGEHSRSFLVSGDAVADRTALSRFVELFERSHVIEAPDESTRTLEIGDDRWPFPIPLVKAAAGWSFDSRAGGQEILARRVGQNELDVIQVCLGYVGAQHDYFELNPDVAPVLHYADRILSSPGKRNGLYWKSSPGEEESPMGPAVSQAVQQGYAPGKRAPYHGYYFRILTAQGPHAEGGALDYRVGGLLTGGFGLLAYPASYGKSGVMTFLVNQSGVVFQKDLGSGTAKTAAAIKRFDPDSSWTPVPP